MTRDRAGRDYELGLWLRAAEMLEIHRSLAYTGATDYAARVCRLHPRDARERLRVARELESLPVLAEARWTGTLCWSAVRELTRVAVEETEGQWLEQARDRTVREVERMVAQHRRGDRPLDPPQPEGKKTIRLEVEAPVWALFQEMRAMLTSDAGGHVDDDALVTTVARAVLGGSDARCDQEEGATGEGARDAGRAPYQIALTVCERCEVATQRAGADDVVVDTATAERAYCDAQHLGRIDVGSPPRATQSIPPRIRRAVVRRHDGRCAVPGCRHACFVDLHHVLPRADGGDHDPELLVALCQSHHAATHVGTLVVKGSGSEGFTFEHADGSRHAAPEASPARSRVFAQVQEALVASGFGMREAQRLIERARTHVGPAPGFDEAMRAALGVWSEHRWGGGVREALEPYLRAA